MTESLNISSGGIFFRTPQTVQPRENLEAWIGWPVLLDMHLPLRLITKGWIVRNDDAGTAMRFDTYEFRTGHVEAKGMRSDREGSKKIAG
jgi:hypothetical protein